MPIFLSQKEKGSKPYPNVKFRTLFYIFLSFQGEKCIIEEISLPKKGISDKLRP